MGPLGRLAGEIVEPAIGPVDGRGEHPARDAVAAQFRDDVFFALGAPNEYHIPIEPMIRATVMMVQTIVCNSADEVGRITTSYRQSVSSFGAL